MIAIELSKQQALDVAPKEIQLTNFTEKEGQSRNAKLFFQRNHFKFISRDHESIIKFRFNLISS